MPVLSKWECVLGAEGRASCSPGFGPQLETRMLPPTLHHVAGIRALEPADQGPRTGLFAQRWVAWSRTSHTLRPRPRIATGWACPGCRFAHLGRGRTSSQKRPRFEVLVQMQRAATLLLYQPLGLSLA